MFVHARAAARRFTLAGVSALGLLVIAGQAPAATLIQYDFTGNVGNEASEAASFVATNLTGTSFTRGPGLSLVTGSNAFNSASWSNYTSSTTPTDYLSFGFGVASGFTATVNQIAFSSRSSNTGPRNLAILAAVDGGAFAQVATFAQTSDATFNRLLTLTPLTAVTSLAFRIVATSTTSANGGTLAGGGTFRVQNFAGTPASPFTISGEVTALPAAAIPEPATWGMMLIGLGLVGMAARRRRALLAA